MIFFQKIEAFKVDPIHNRKYQHGTATSSDDFRVSVIQKMRKKYASGYLYTMQFHCSRKTNIKEKNKSPRRMMTMMMKKKIIIATGY
jgi:hypothetical protein